MSAMSATMASNWRRAGMNFDQLPTQDLVAGKPTASAGSEPVLRQDHRQRLRPFQPDGRVLGSCCGHTRNSATSAYRRPLGSSSHYNASAESITPTAGARPERAGFLHILEIHRQHSRNQRPGRQSASAFPFATTTTWLPRNRWTPRTSRTAWLSATSTSFLSARARKSERTSTPWPTRWSAVGRSQASAHSSQASRSVWSVEQTTPTRLEGTRGRTWWATRPSSNPTIQQWFNTSAFQQPAPFTFGNAPRYMSNVRSPGMEVFDIGVQKWFHYREILKLQFRAEMFNAFNRANFYSPDGSFGDPRFWTDLGHAAAARHPDGTEVVLVSARAYSHWPGGFDCWLWHSRIRTPGWNRSWPKPIRPRPGATFAAPRPSYRQALAIRPGYRRTLEQSRADAAPVRRIFPRRRKRSARLCI